MITICIAEGVRKVLRNTREEGAVLQEGEEVRCYGKVNLNQRTHRIGICLAKKYSGGLSWQ